MNRRNFHKNIVGALPFVSIPLIASDMAKKKYPKKIIKPKRLKPGDTIGLIAPASQVAGGSWEKAAQNIKDLGFKVKYDEKRASSRYGYLAGKDETRAEELNAMFADSEIDGIWCVRGGYGSARILPMLDYKMIRKNPKVLVGYSDITALIQGIFLKTGLICFHGPAAFSSYPNYTKTNLLEVLTNPKDAYLIESPKEYLEEKDMAYQSYVINKGTATGALIGGNLSLVASLMGTSYELDMIGKILFLEDIGEKPYRLDRMLTQLLLGGKLDKVAGIALGIFKNCDATGNTLSLIEMLKDRLDGLSCPVIYGLPFGHISRQCTLPVGVKARLNTEKRTLELLESGVV